MSKAASIERDLLEALSPAHLDVEDESHLHNVPKGAESHFKVVVVSDAFEGLPLVRRHRRVNQIVDMPTRNIHALALHTFTPKEWQEAGRPELGSPDCLGGSKR